ncbi:MAG: hypothetical protein QOF89_1946 [Acidobacteriota bacterium]|jgi:hypothetical protein|nr:hypothetical protein [Acidobacteriota bacterium]
MSRSSVARRVAAFLVILALALPLGAAAHPVPGAPLSGLWQWLALQWDKVGCTVDPNGCAGNAQGPARTPEAPSDPQKSADVGCTLDPNGKPCSGHP